MANFTALAYETILEILSFLSCPDLASTSRVSHRLHIISQPLLYTAPCLSKTPSMTGTSQLSPAIGILLQTLLTPGNETLASHVRSLHIDWDPIEVKPASVFSTDSISLITIMASKMNLYHPLKSNSSQFMLLLELLPHLQSLHLTPPNNGSFTRRLRTRLTIGRLPLGLQSLREIICPPPPTGTDLSISNLLQFMQFPGVRYIAFPCLATFMPFTQLVFALDSAVATSRITRLCFSHGQISAWLLKSVLHIPIALTHFSYTAALDVNFDLPGFMNSLQPLQKSLRVLHLDFGGVGSSDDEEQFLLPYNEGSLRGWSMLTTLSCSLMSLLGKGQLDGSPRLSNVLPEGLTELEILHDSYWWVPEGVEQVVDMLGRKESVVPRLERLAVVVGWGKTERAVRLGMACEVAGVEFVNESFCWLGRC